MSPFYVLPWLGSVATVAGGLLVATSNTAESAPAANAAGWVVAACGLATTGLTLFFRDRSESRRLHVRDLRHAAEEAGRRAAVLEARVRELEGQASQVQANAERIAALDGHVAVAEGKAEGALDTLKRIGWIQSTTRPGRPPATVLVVDDDLDTTRALVRLFATRGYSVVGASTLDEAHSLLDLGPHWMVLDIKLGAADGLDLLRRVRDQRMHTRVVITTGVTDPERIVAARKLSPEALLVKPIDLEELFRTLGSAAPPPPQPPPAQSPSPVP